MLYQNERVKEEGRTLKTGDPVQNRYRKKPQGDSRQRSVPSGTEAIAESETSIQETKQMKNKAIINFRESRELDT